MIIILFCVLCLCDYFNMITATNSLMLFENGDLFVIVCKHKKKKNMLFRNVFDRSLIQNVEIFGTRYNFQSIISAVRKTT